MPVPLSSLPPTDINFPLGISILFFYWFMGRKFKGFMCCQKNKYTFLSTKSI
jgi:hypothetical protein